MMNIIILGMKHSGKSSLARDIAAHYGMDLLETDYLVEKFYAKQKNEFLSCREIVEREGIDYFRKLETEVLREVTEEVIQHTVLDTGGGTPLSEENQELLKMLGTIVFLDLDEEENLRRIIKEGIPPFFKYPTDPQRSFAELIQERRPVYRFLADITLEVKNNTPEEVLGMFVTKYEEI
ncbi:hypothetical protein K9M41_04300 [Candidatus Gracilibacteria bacterium]|nr:hypothetical protein [Candidatus Gracilibacteria bacterium]